MLNFLCSIWVCSDLILCQCSVLFFNISKIPVKVRQFPYGLLLREPRHFLIPWTGGAFAPLGPFLCPTTEMAYCLKAWALGPVLSKRV